MKTSLAIVFVVAIFIVGNYVTTDDVMSQQIDETFNNINAVEVNGSFMNVEVESHDADNVHLWGELTTKKAGDDSKILYEVKGGTLSVWVEKDNKMFQNISGHLKLEVPKYIRVKVNNSSGSITARNLKNDKLGLTSSSGSIHAEGLQGKMNVSASSGSISLSGIEGELDVTTSSGSIKVYDAEGNISARSSSGSQVFEDIEGKIRTNASSGSLRFNSVEGKISAVTSSGSIRVTDFEGALNLTSSSGSQSGQNVQLKADSEFHSVSGSITMNLDNNADDFTFDLRATSGSLKAFGSSGSKTLKTGDGVIMVRGSSSSGSQRYN
ncbi:DUF4097 family beta strand repeat-containing protein [Saccharicrinis sp. FJH62]|uniref:DUF4097 family beta strand repeat-containing protein n=1 Tax=Saccharicrinis sp. FJH62 TaxID=3344657 RepID=UPI0035D52221